MRFGTRHLTRTEREAYANIAGQQTWHAFKRRLESASTLEQARAVAREAPGEARDAGRALYARLEAFLETFEAPPRCTPAERVLYRALLQRLERAGGIDAERAWALIERLNHF